MTNTSRQDTLRRMETMLHRCRRQIMLAKLAVRLREAMEFYAMCLLGIAGMFLLFRLGAYLVAVPSAFSLPLMLAVATIFACAIFGREIWLVVWRKGIQTSCAAERLDLSQSTHNRIATAIALLRSGEESPFARAAIRDGFECLERLQAERPYVAPSATSWRRKGTWLAVSIVMILAGQLIEASPQAPGELDLPRAPVLAARDGEPLSDVPDGEKEPTKRATKSDNHQEQGNAPTPEEEPDESDGGKHADPGLESRSEGPAGRRATGKSSTSQTSSNSRSAASGAGGKSEPGKAEPDNKKKKPRQTTTKPNNQPKVEQKNEKGGSINARGSSGSGSMRTAQNEWDSEVKAKSSDSDDFEQEEEPDDDMDKDKQRLGVQPALKSRTSRVSRELSLALGKEPKNNQMRGRGGPGGQKKARGTAMMIMGVPVPGFVRGRLLPGSTKSTQEEVEPSPRPGDYVEVSQLHQTQPQETHQERYRPSAALEARAREYLIKYHAENENRRNGAATNE